MRCRRFPRMRILCTGQNRPRDRAFPEDRPWRTSARANREVHDGPMRSQHVARELFDR
jgi:hypothetical protein